jgi:hypothetical protein
VQPTIDLRGRQVATVFELIGRDENALTFALGWCLAKAPRLLAELASLLGAKGIGAGVRVILQEYSGKNGITDIELIVPGQFACIIEAKVGHVPPSLEQLTKYAVKLNGAKECPSKVLVVLARSDRQDLWLRRHVPSKVRDIPVLALSWGQVKDAISRAYPASDNTAKSLLRQLREFIEGVLILHSVTSNKTFVVSVGRRTFQGGNTTLVEVVENCERYFHHDAKGWPREPPNYIAFRWGGRLQSIHHIDYYEIITNFHPHFPSCPSKETDPYFLYKLGPAIRPAKVIRTGDIVRDTRVWAHLDLLLTSETIWDAWNKTKQREKAATE